MAAIFLSKNMGVYMINSSKRKLSLSGWLKNNSRKEYDSPLKLQKFLFFYESFSKVKGKESEFSYLKGYKNGPVFSNVYGDYTKERKNFDNEAEKALINNSHIIDSEIAIKAKFLVSALTESELSALSHKMNIWNCKEKQINSGEQQVSLSESDFNNNDIKIIEDLDKMYSLDFIQKHKIVSVGKNYYIFSNDDIPKISAEQIDVLYELSTKKELDNPVYVKINDEGVMEID